MRVDARCILLKEGDCGFLLLRMVFVFDTREVFYIKNLENVPSTGRASLSASSESSCNIVECMSHKFSTVTLGCFLHLGEPVTPYTISPMRAGFVWPMRGIFLYILLNVSLMDQPLDFFLELVTTFGVVLFDFVELIYLVEEALHMALELEAYGCCVGEEPRAKFVHDEHSEA